MILRLLAKLILLPVSLAVTVIQWVMLFLNCFSSVIFSILSGVVFLIALLSRLFGISTGMETLQTLLISFVLFMIPVIGGKLIEWVMSFRTAVSRFIRS